MINNPLSQDEGVMFLFIMFVCFKINSFFYVYGCFALYVCLCTLCVPGGFGSQRSMVDSLKLELFVVMSHYVGAGNQTKYSTRAARVLTTKSSLKPVF